MEGDIVNYGVGGLLAYAAIKELGGLAKGLVERKNGNGGDANVGHGVKAIMGWLTTKGCDIHTACSKGAASLHELVNINREAQLQQQEITREERKWRADMLNSFMRDMK